MFWGFSFVVKSKIEKMKSQKIFPVEKRFSNGEYAIGVGKFAYYALVSCLKQYHKALTVAERELNLWREKMGVVKGFKSKKLFPVEKRIVGGDYKGDYTKRVYYERIVRYISRYHKALAAAEKEIEVLKNKNEVLKTKCKMKTKATKKFKR